jgi:hypothetical protein
MGVARAGHGKNMTVYVFMSDVRFFFERQVFLFGHETDVFSARHIRLLRQVSVQAPADILLPIA